MNIPYIIKMWNIPKICNIEKVKNSWKTLFKRKEFFKYMEKTGEEKKVNTYVLDSSHRKVKGFAGLRGIDVPDAYDMLVCAGLKALGYDPATFK